jgi:hypothetical protein
MAKQVEILRFNGVGTNYYSSIPQGYGGFNWGSMDYMNATYWQNEHQNWCDTGYQNAIRGSGEAVASNGNGLTTTAYFQSPTLSETFDLKSMIASSAWETDQPFYFKSYAYEQGQGFVLKATDTVYLSQKAQLINFAKIGKPGDFQNISQVTIISGSGKYGNTCSYGQYGYTLGNQMAFDNMKVKWNGAIPKSGGKLATHAHGHAAHIVGPQLVFGDAHHGTSPDAHTNASGISGAPSSFHGETMSSGESGSGALTNQFHLPAVEHFGT